jgi:hypothetical protein
MLRSDKISHSNLRSVKMPDLPISTSDATPVVIGRDVYLAGGLTLDLKSAQIVQVFNVRDQKWRTLPSAPQYWSEALAINGNLVLVGGRDSFTSKITNVVSTWAVDEGKWLQMIPPMSTRRGRPGVLLLKNFLFVFGGIVEDGKTLLDSFEVLDLTKNQWTSGHGLLLRPLWGLKLGVYEDTVVATCAWDTPTKATVNSWTIPVRVLMESVVNPSSQPLPWTPITDTPCFLPSLLANSKQPLLVGGFKGLEAVRDIYVFSSDGWGGHLSDVGATDQSSGGHCQRQLILGLRRTHLSRQCPGTPEQCGSDDMYLI